LAGGCGNYGEGSAYGGLQMHDYNNNLKELFCTNYLIEPNQKEKNESTLPSLALDGKIRVAFKTSSLINLLISFKPFFRKIKKHPSKDAKTYY